MTEKVQASSAAATRRSDTSPPNAASLSSADSARRIDDGCTVATIDDAGGNGSTTPRDFVTRNVRPSNVCAAVAPSATTSRGRSTANSAWSHGLHASTSRVSGFTWTGRLPVGDGVHLTCLTALVT